jgi:hypothetical protein
MDQMTRRTFGAQQSPAVNNSGPAGRNQGTGSIQRRAAPANSQGWNRFSGPAGGSGQSAVRTTQDRPSGGNLRTPQSSQPNLQGGSVSRNSGNGWTRFGTGSGTTSRDPGSGSSSPRSVERGQNYGSNGGSVAPRSASPRYERPAPSSPQTYRGGGQGPVRINPPIVRERTPSSGGGGRSYSRPAPSYGGGGYSRPAPGGGGSYSRSAPSAGGGGSYSRPAPSGGGNYSRPAPSGGGNYSRSAPSGGGNYSRPAPSSGGGGRNNGGGGGRQNGRSR